MNCAQRYAIIEAPTANEVFPNTSLNISLSTGDHDVASRRLARETISKQNKLAITPIKTIWFAFLAPYISETKSVTRKVIG